jgi:hypothetical protein
MCQEANEVHAGQLRNKMAVLAQTGVNNEKFAIK